MDTLEQAPFKLSSSAGTVDSEDVETSLIFASVLSSLSITNDAICYLKAKEKNETESKETNIIFKNYHVY